ncbi:MAG: manganese efflux pump [Propionibacterium sp.]|nr:manganese efflux pump [Propionibacterium sp.]
MTLGLFLVAIGLSMDAGAVAVGKGMAMGRRVQPRAALIIAAWFGIFQGLMPLLGYFLGTGFRDAIASIDHWIAFGLLALIGAHMLIEAFREHDEQRPRLDTGIRAMFVLAVATSIDALAAGISFALLEVNIWIAAVLITVVTFVITLIGVKLGSAFGGRFQKPAEIVGGVILILMGVRILLDHLVW